MNPFHSFMGEPPVVELDSTDPGNQVNHRCGSARSVFLNPEVYAHEDSKFDVKVGSYSSAIKLKDTGTCLGPIYALLRKTMGMTRQSKPETKDSYAKISTYVYLVRTS